MQSLQITEAPRLAGSVTTSRDVLAGFFRRQRLLLTSFLAIFAAGAVLAVLIPEKYESQAKILLSRERQDPAISADAKAAFLNQRGVSEEDVNSEIELITSADLLEQVVRRCELEKKSSLLARISDLFRDTSEKARVARAVDRLQGRLNVAPINGSNLLRVSYRSGDPELSAKVVRTVTDLYLEKHLAVHRRAGVYQFFQKEAESYKHELEEAQSRVAQFARTADTVAAQVERDSAVQRATETEFDVHTTQAAIRQTQNRIHSLRSQLGTTPERVVTSDRNEDAALMAQLKGALVNLELKRTELLRKYQPGYAAVVEIDKQIAQTRAAIETEGKSPIRTVTTDRNPIAELLNQELAKSRAELAALQAKEVAGKRTLWSYRQSAKTFLDKGLVQGGLLREAKVAEDNYLLYTAKREEARIADALDRRRVVNVTVAQSATVPYLPVLPKWMVLLAAFVLACAVSVSLGLAANFMDTSLHTPREVEGYLDLPVLAAVPAAPRTRRALANPRKMLPA